MEGKVPCWSLYLVLYTLWLPSFVTCEVLDNFNVQIYTEGQIQVLCDINNGNTYRKDCSELRQEDVSESGVYMIQPVTFPKPFYVYCDMETDGGGWTVFQRRLDGSVGFYRGWEEYKEGFGNTNSEYWLGNEKLFYLTAQGHYELRVDLADFEGETRYALYDKFRMGDETTFYKLMLGNYSGNAGRALDPHNGNGFSTKDADHDWLDGRNCAMSHKGAWWFGQCVTSHLNGIYHGGEHESFADGIHWATWHDKNYSLKSTEMKIRRLIEQ